MNVDIRLVTAKEIPAMLPLVEQYWLFEDIAGFELHDKMLETGPWPK